MKRKFSELGIVVILMMFAFALPCSAAQTVEVINDGKLLIVNVNGEKVNFDQSPYISNGRTMVPFGAIAKALGAKVNWDTASKKVTITGNKKVELIIGSIKAMVDGNEVALDSPAVIVGGRTMVPLAFVGGALGAEVSYTPKLVQTVQPTSSGSLLPNEDKIQKELTQEDIDRLNSYGVTAKVEEDIKKSSSSVETQAIWRNHKAYRPDVQRYRKCLDIFEDICNFDYRDLERSDYREEFKNTFYRISDKYYNEKSMNDYIDGIIKNKQTIKCSFLTSDNLIYAASPQFVAIRAKYIFYQSSGSKMVEEGSSLGKWYYRDIELYFVTAFLTPNSGNTTGLSYVGYSNLSAPQPYFN